ncbi:SEFIR domain-containing protein [Amycolatopsis thermoflava]
MRNPGTVGISPRVYVSYTRDSPEHVRSVREFAAFLRTGLGVDAEHDEWHATERRDWIAWTVDQLRTAEFVLAIASPEYKRVADGGRQRTEGRTREFEAAMLRDNLARNIPESTRRVLPVVLPGGRPEDIPDCLCSSSQDYYSIPEFTRDAAEDLLRVLTGAPLHEKPPLGTFTPPAPGVDPVVVVHRAAVPPTDRVLAVGAVVDLGGVRRLVDGRHWSEHPNRDHSAVCRQARASALPPDDGSAWLRQVEVRQPTGAADAAVAALAREHEILTVLDGRAPELPRPLGFFRDGHLATLATRWPTSRSLGGPGETLATDIPAAGESVDPWRMRQVLRGVAGLCGALAALHATGAAHRNLAPERIIRLDDGRLALVDLGLAASAPTPGEGPDRYRAPEQRRGSSRLTGAAADVYQVAAVTCHLLTGTPPSPAVALPIRGRVPALPDSAAAVLDAALAADPAARPAMSALIAALSTLPAIPA